MKYMLFGITNYNLGNNHAFGCKHSDASKLQQSNKMKGRLKPRIECPHCKLVGGISQMKQWHFDNCKNINSK